MSDSSRSIVADALAADRLGAPSVIAFALTAAAPLMVIGGVVTVGWATTGAATGITAYPLAFLLIAAVLAIFTVGYMAMSRRISNAGAFYSYVAQGAGRPAGVAAALVAFVSYNLLQVGLYGIFGFTMQQFVFAAGNVDVQWWIYSLAAWAVTAILGLLRVDINGGLLLTIVALEVVTVIVFDFLFLTNPADGEISFATFDPANLFLPGVGALLVTVVTAFVGFEAAAVYSEESKDRKRTVPMASYLTIGLMVVFYAITSWAIAVTVGDENLVEVAGEQQTEMMFGLAAAHFGSSVISELGVLLLLTSVFAAMLSYHNTVARYTFSLAREGVLPRALARTSMRSGSPKNASMLQSGIGVVMILLFAFMDWDPLTHMFFWLGMNGGFGVLLLITATAIAVVTYFAKRPGDANVWTRLIAPVTSASVLLVVVYFAVEAYGPLLGLEPGDPLAWIFPLSYAVLIAVGMIVALVLRSTSPDVYARIGRGADERPDRPERKDDDGAIVPVFVGGGDK